MKPIPLEVAPSRVDWAFFLAADGLLDASAANEAAPAEVIDLLEGLRESFSGAVALVSGRSLADLDRIFHPLRLPSIAAHGSECRMPDGIVAHALCNPKFLEIARPVMRAFADEHPAVRLSDKGTCLALHTPRDRGIYREASDLVAWLADVSESSFVAQEGSFTVDLKPVTANLGHCLVSFLAQPPFRGRVPVVSWDSSADAGIFHAARIREGIGISIGVEVPLAGYHVENPRAYRRWLKHARTASTVAESPFRPR